MGQRRSARRRRRRRRRPKAIPEHTCWEIFRGWLRGVMTNGWGTVFLVAFATTFVLMLLFAPGRRHMDDPSSALLPVARGWLVVPAVAMTASGVAFAVREGWLLGLMITCLGLTALGLGLDYWAPESPARLLLLPGAALWFSAVVWIISPRGRDVDRRWRALGGALMFGTVSLGFALGGL